MHDQREKAQRDYEWAISSARQEGIEKGIEQGIERGEQLGAFKGKIQLLQELLDDRSATPEELNHLNADELALQVATLQQRLRERLA